MSSSNASESELLCRWRVQSAATRDHALSSMTSTPSALTHATGGSAPSPASRGHHSHVSGISKFCRIKMVIELSLSSLIVEVHSVRGTDQVQHITGCNYSRQNHQHHQYCTHMEKPYIK